MGEPISNQFLETRVKTLHNRVTETLLKAASKEVTEKALKRALSEGTLSLLDTIIDGKPVRIITTDKPALYKALKQHRYKLLLPGEILGSGPVYVSPPLKESRSPRGYYGRPKPPRRNQYIHAEQLGANDARRMGAKTGRIATSNAGCTNLCISLLHDEFPEFTHVNPQTRKPDASIGTGQSTRKPKEPPSPDTSTKAASRKTPQASRPTAAERGTTNTSLHETPTSGAKSASAGGQLPSHPAGPKPPTSATKSMTAAPSTTSLVPSGTQRGVRARTIVLGFKAWRAARVIVKVAVILFVPLKALDVVFEVALALWDRNRERDERARRDKQRTLEAVFKQGRDQLERRARALLSDGPRMQALIDQWDRNRRSNGFYYLRLHARLAVDTQRPLYGLERDVIEHLTKYSLLRLDVDFTTWSHEFTVEQLGEPRVVELSEQDKQEHTRRGSFGLTVKTTRERKLSYTIVPPVVTPFDIIITKLNNLFVDIVAFAALFHGAAALEEFEGFNFTYSWDEQFTVLPNFSPPLKAAVCEYCMGYVFSAAKRLSRHSVEQQDLEGNLEDPWKGWRRRFAILQTLVDPREAPYGKNFTYLAEQLRRIIKPSALDAETAAALDELYLGARLIWYDLERIERNMHSSEYFYLGPSYNPKE